MRYFDLLGKRFRYGGRGPEHFDCYGLVMEMYRRQGIDLPEYESFADPRLIDAGLSDGRERWVTGIEAPEAGCMVMFRVHPPYVSHIGVMLDSLRFIHIMHKTGVAVERIDSLLWRDKLAGFYRYNPHE